MNDWGAAWSTVPWLVYISCGADLDSPRFNSVHIYVQRFGNGSSLESFGAVPRRSGTLADERFAGREDTSGAAAAKFAAPNSHPEYISVHYKTGAALRTLHRCAIGQSAGLIC
jgi:hypothetical protein